MRRLFALFRRSRLENEMTEEFREHMRVRASDLERAGLSHHEAERRARIEFGSEPKFREECREAFGFNLLEVISQDLRFGARVLWKSPGFTAVAVLTLALGIGATAAMFSVVYASLLRPLPYRDPNRLVILGEMRGQLKQGGTPFYNVSYPDFLDWSKQTKSFEAMSGYTGDGFTLRGLGDPRPVIAAQATVNFFSTLGVAPFMGRDFAPGEDIADGPKVTILTYNAWHDEFNGDPAIIGRAIQLDSNSVTVIGVLPQSFEFAPRGAAEFWVPLHMNQGMQTRRSLRWMPVIARMKPGVTFEQMRAEMNTINHNLSAAYPQENGSTQLLITPLRERILGNVRPVLLMLFGAVGFVLLIACANVANLLMARATGRRREFNIRAALGAGRTRLVLQVLSESVILAASGGVLGLVVSQWATRLLIGAIPANQLATMPYLRDVSGGNPAVVAFLFVVIVFAALAFGLAPALQVSQKTMGGALKEETRGSAGRGRTGARRVFVVAEIAFCLVLLAGAGLMVKSLTAMLHHDPGFDMNNVLTFGVALPPDAYPKNDDLIAFDRTITARLAASPGISGVANNSVIPLTGGGNTIRFLVEGHPMAAGTEFETNIRSISPTYFSVMKIPLIGGRFFNDVDDTATAPQRVIVNQDFVNQFTPNENPIGKRIVFTFSPTQKYREIVGVVGGSVDKGLDTSTEPAVYLPFQQSTNNFLVYFVRTQGPPTASVATVRNVLAGINPTLPLIQPFSMEEIVARSPSVFLRRYPSYLIGSFAGLALVLATIGLYGVISYAVSQRTREIGIRLALGAQRSHVMRLVLGDGTRLALIGVAVGLTAGLGMAKLVSTMLYGVSAYDPATYVGMAGLLLIVAIAACYVPARRAVRVDPVVALRYE